MLDQRKVSFSGSLAVATMIATMIAGCITIHVYFQALHRQAEVLLHSGVTTLADYWSHPELMVEYAALPFRQVLFVEVLGFPAKDADTIANTVRGLLEEHAAKTIGLGGTSAGGGLALASVQRLKELGLDLPGALWAGTPWSDLTKTGDSQYTNEGIDRSLVAYEGVLETCARLYAGGQDLKMPLLSPVYGSFDGFPPTYLVTGTRDLFLSDTVRVHRKLRSAGVVADLNVYEGMSHGIRGHWNGVHRMINELGWWERYLKPTRTTPVSDRY